MRGSPPRDARPAAESPPWTPWHSPFGPARSPSEVPFLPKSPPPSPPGSDTRSAARSSPDLPADIAAVDSAIEALERIQSELTERMRATPAARPADPSSEFAQMKARAEMMTSGSRPKPAEPAASPGKLSQERVASFERDPTPDAQEAEAEPPVDETFWAGLQRSISSLLQGSAKKPKLAHARTAPRLDDTSAGGRLATRDAKLADLAAREAELRVHVSTAIAAIRGMEGEMREHERRVAGAEEQLGPLTKENAAMRMAVMQSRQAQADATSALAKAREEADAIELQIEKLRDPTGTALQDFFAEESGVEGVTTPASGASTVVKDVRPRRAHASTPHPQWRAHSIEYLTL